MIDFTNGLDFSSLAPLLTLIIGALFILLYESFTSRITMIPYYMMITILSISLITTFTSPNSHSPLITTWLRYDALSKFFTAFFLLIGLAVTFLSYPFFKQFNLRCSEYFFFNISAIFGLILIGSAADFLTLFIGIETLSLSLYILCSYVKNWGISQEASLKYFFMGSLAAAFLLYGVALVYGAIGTTQFDALLSSYNNLSSLQNQILFLSGMALITIGLSFEAAVVPFHIWAPDVYAGSSTPVTAFMSVGTKVGALAAFIRVYFDALPHFDPWWSEAVSLLAYITLIYANFVAMLQTQLRRFFAYSGIAHAGFMLIPLATGNDLNALLFYLIVYAIATIGCFSVLSILDKKPEGVTLKDLNGLFQHSPFLTVIFTFFLLTLAGIPPTLGFFAKFYVLKNAFEVGFYGLVFVALLTTILSAYYYLRIAIAMYLPSEEEKSIEISWPPAFVGILSTVALIFFIFFPMDTLHF